MKIEDVAVGTRRRRDDAIGANTADIDGDGLGVRRRMRNQGFHGFQARVRSGNFATGIRGNLTVGVPFGDDDIRVVLADGVTPTRRHYGVDLTFRGSRVVAREAGAVRTGSAGSSGCCGGSRPRRGRRSRRLIIFFDVLLLAGCAAVMCIIISFIVR